MPSLRRLSPRNQALSLPTEHEKQVSLVEWWSWARKRWKLPEFALFAIPNAGAGSQKGQAGKLKAEGVRKGIPDLALSIPRGGFHGLYIEMKRVGERARPDQLEVLSFFRSQGYETAVCEGALDATEVIFRYLERSA